RRAVARLPAPAPVGSSPATAGEVASAASRRGRSRGMSSGPGPLQHASHGPPRPRGGGGTYAHDKEERVSEAKSPSRMIDERITELGDWRGRMLSRLRALIKE